MPSTVTIPCYRQWIVKMCHFGVDSIDEYTGKEFHVTFEEGMSDLFRIYTKRMENNKQRSEQNTKNILAKMLHIAYAFVQKLFPEGHLIDVNGSTAKEERT
ncbi:MAG: hypothetical protein WBL88_10530 [Nitrososphaeraceae archaeon]